MTSGADASFTTIKSSCACSQLKVSVEVPTSALPLPLTLCHCDTCRHVSGLLCVGIISLPRGARPLQVQGTPQAYHESPRLSRCFCPLCGTSVYEDSPDQSRIALTSGALVKAEGIVTLDQNIFVADTKDGGLREWLLHIPAWEGQSKGQSKEIPEGVPYAATAATMSNKTSSDVLQCTCHCEGVSFAISRPKPESSALHANWSDSLVPYFDNASGNGGDAKWWICANGTKYLATVCACKSCRLGSGYDLQFWLFCPEVNIQKTNGDPIDFEMGTLQRYHSSPGVSREFCKVCGATVFWRSDERPGFVDVSFGLLNADSGARAEEWVEWCSKRVSFLEFAQNRALVESVSAGLKEWATREKKHIW